MAKLVGIKDDLLVVSQLGEVIVVKLGDVLMGLALIEDILLIIVRLILITAKIVGHS